MGDGSLSMQRDEVSSAHPPARVPLRPLAAILGLTVFAHGLLLPWLGFYWDDLPKSWFLHLLGPMGFWKVYQVDRPFLPWIYMFTTPLLGESPAGWQVLGLVARALTAAAVWWVVRLIWPRREALALLTALFFVVYPGFLQGPISLIYSHYFLLYALLLASLAFSVQALRGTAQAWRWTGAGLLSLALVLFSFEYLVGLELIRPVVLGIVLWQAGVRGRKLLDQVLRRWLPYAAVFVLFLLWRSLVIRFPTYDPELFEGLGEVPVAQLGSLGARVAGDLYVASLGAWVHAMRLPDASVVGRFGLAVMAVAGAAAVAVTLWGMLDRRAFLDRQPDPGRRTELVQALLLGGWSLLVAGIPVWTALLTMRLGFPRDRFTLPFMLGSSLLASALLLSILRSRKAAIGAAAVLVGLASVFHAANAMTYVRDWEKLNGFLSQLTERVPGLEPGTALLMDAVPLEYSTDNSLTAPVNWAYAPDLDSTRMPFLVVSIPIRLGGSLTSLEPGTPITSEYRATTFEGSTSQAIVIYYKPFDCLQVLDPELHDGMPTLSEDLQQALPLSRLELIDTEALPPARSPFAQRGEPGWCSYFQRADLARQRGDWTQVVALGDLALGGPDRAKHGSEYIPFIEGYGRVSRWDDALAWSRTALERNPEIDAMLCRAWSRIEASAPAGEAGRQAIDKAQALAGCGGDSR
jgi:hypothetical protein